MGDLGTLSFGGVDGVVIPAGTRQVQPVESPSLLPAVVRTSVAPLSRLTYMGFFAEAPSAALYAMIGDPIDVTDATLAEHTVMLHRLEIRQLVPALDEEEDVAGWWCEVDVEVQAWD